MKVLLWYIIVASALNTLFKACYLGLNKYPRTMTYKPGEDAVGLIISMSFLGWAIYLLRGL